MPELLSIYRHCFPGWFPLFAIGIWIANNNKPIEFIEKLSGFMTFILLVLLAVLIVLMNINIVTWLIVPIVSLLFFLLLAKVVVNIRYADDLFKKVGVLSAAIFVCHPIARKVLFISHIYDYGVLISLILYTLLTFVIAYYYKKIYDRLLTEFIK